MQFRLALLYVVVFTQVGVGVPFWPLWLKSQGLDAVQIGWVLACGQWVRVVSTPAIAHHADRHGALRGTLIATTFVSALLFLPFLWARGFWAFALTSIGFHFLWAATVPLMDALMLHAQREHAIDYGKVRVFGSVSFALSAVAAGAMVDRFGAQPVPFVLLGTVVLSALTALAAPRLASAPVAERPRVPLADLVRDRRFLALVAGASLITGSHAVFYGFATLRWQAAGVPEDTIGLLWMTGVAAESLLFLLGRRLVTRFGPVRLVLAGAVACVVRWTVLASTVSLPLTFAAQSLHGVTFAATHWGMMLFIQQSVRQAIATSAQSLYAALAGGLALGCATIAAGRWYAAYGAHAYHWMSLLAVLGGLAAWSARRPAGAALPLTPR